MGLSETLPGVTSRAGSGVKPEREGLRETLQLASVFALVTFVLHVAINLRAQHIGYGLFRDEMYYIVCGRHLAWGVCGSAPHSGACGSILRTGIWVALACAVSVAAFSRGSTGGGRAHQRELCSQ
jgi:hypothetical protein